VDERGILTQEALRTIQAQEQAQTTRTPTLISGSHALRINTSAADFADGSLFRETDRSLVYVAIQGSLGLPRRNVLGHASEYPDPAWAQTIPGCCSMSLTTPICWSGMETHGHGRRERRAQASQ
jgi:hypothetical protein